jgi:putative hydrolase of the HAD superfamily
MSEYTGAFPPPPDDDAPFWARQPAPAEPEAAPEPEAPARQGRLGSFRFDLEDEPAAEPEPGGEDEAEAAPALPFDLLAFDFAGMLVSSPIHAVAGLAPTLGIDPPKLLDIVFGPYSTADTDHPWHKLERNEITSSAYDDHLRAQGAELGIDLDFDRIRPLLLSVDVNEVVIEFIVDRRAEGFRTALISNMTKEVTLAWKQLLPLGQLFDAVIDSASVGIRKPNPAIFRQVLHQLGVEPSRAVLLDDTLGNVDGARSIGMAGIHVVRDPSIGLKQLNVLMGRGRAGEDG